MIASGEHAARFALSARFERRLGRASAEQCVGELEGESTLADAGRAGEQVRAGKAAGFQRLPKSLDEIIMAENAAPHFNSKSAVPSAMR
jgi:hypothetical protein